jgi:hypothetical protein
MFNYDYLVSLFCHTGLRMLYFITTCVLYIHWVVCGTRSTIMTMRLFGLQDYSNLRNQGLTGATQPIES